MVLKNKQLEELLDIFESELREILKKYVWEINSKEVRALIVEDIQKTFFNSTLTPKTRVVDNTTPELEKRNVFDFKIKEGKKEYTFVQYIEKVFFGLTIEKQ